MTEVEKLIPHRPPFLFVDKIIAHDGDTLVAQRTWRAGEDFYKGHYPGAPITPGVLLCESVFQTGALLMAKLMGAQAAGAGRPEQSRTAGAGGPGGVPLLTKVTDVRFRLPVYPGDTTTIEVRRKETMGDFHFMSGTVKNGDKRVLNLEFSVAWKKPEGQITVP